MIDLKNQKTCVMGIQGSGKTYATENFLIKNFKHPFIYLIHTEDFTKAPNSTYIYVPKRADGNIDTSMTTLEVTCARIKQLAKSKQVDCLVIDEADMFIPKDLRELQKYPNFYDLVINHRHYNLAMILITRRPQDIPTIVIESCKHLFIFAIEGKNVQEHLKNVHPQIKELLPELSIDNHKFIYKQVGKPPKLYSSINAVKG